MSRAIMRWSGFKTYTSIFLVCFWGNLPPSIARAQNLKTDKPVTSLVFFGDSITAGYGLPGDRAFPALIQKRIDSMGWHMSVVNAGLSGETSAGGSRRITWTLQLPVSVFILELGANDALRGLDLGRTKKNLEFILDRVREKYPEAKLVVVGMQAPPNLGQAYTAGFRELFPALARRYKAALVPFLLKGVGGIPELNLPDGIHPTVKGHAIVAETVWETLKPILEQIDH